MLTELRTLVMLADEGSIQAVAKRLPLSQPAVTRQIQRLEESLGLQLLDRRQKPPVFTPAGMTVVERSRRILSDYEGMRELGRGSEPAGLLRLGVTHGLADERLASVVQQLRIRYPKVSLRLATGWSAELSDRLGRGQLDAAIVLSGESRPGATRIGREQLAIIASEDLAGTLRRGADLRSHRWILSPEPCDARRLLGRALTRMGIGLEIAAEVQDSRLQLALVRTGAGLGLMPERLAHARADGLAVIDAEGPGLGLGLALGIYVERSPYLHRMAAVVDDLAALLVPADGM